LFNSAIETLFHGLDPETKSRWNGCLDIAAGAVLTASGFAVLIGVLVFGNRIGQLSGWW
jgi:diacylglycerol kinase